MYREALKYRSPMRRVSYIILSLLSLSAAFVAFYCYFYALKHNIAFKLHSSGADLNITKTLTYLLAF